MNERMAELFGQGGAKVFVGGSVRIFAKSTAEICMKMYRDTFPEKTEEEAFQWLERVREYRYVSDVFE
jgi:cytochrome P450/NADPH-cytochrome P450 reductase